MGKWLPENGIEYIWIGKELGVEFKDEKSEWVKTLGVLDNLV